MSVIKDSNRLSEVTFMRTVLAIFIVLMHSFTCYNGVGSILKAIWI